MNLILRKAVADDSRDIWLWRNDEETRRNSRTVDVIPWQCHDAWYRRMLENRGCQILVALDSGNRNGVLRFDQIETNLFRANIVMAPFARGRHLGRVILHLGCDWLMKEYPHATIFAEVRIENIASRRIFEANGFHRDPAQQQSEFYVYLKRAG